MVLNDRIAKINMTFNDLLPVTRLIFYFKIPKCITNLKLRHKNMGDLQVWHWLLRQAQGSCARDIVSICTKIFEYPTIKFEPGQTKQHSIFTIISMTLTFQVASCFWAQHTVSSIFVLFEYPSRSTRTKKAELKFRPLTSKCDCVLLSSRMRDTEHTHICTKLFESPATHREMRPRTIFGKDMPSRPTARHERLTEKIFQYTH